MMTIPITIAPMTATPDGKQFIDALAGLWCCNLGLSNSALADAADQQLRTLPYHHSFWGQANPQAEALADRLTKDVATEALDMSTAVSGAGGGRMGWL